jgi:hypothetical protein
VAVGPAQKTPLISSSRRPASRPGPTVGAVSITVTDIGNNQTYPATVIGYDHTHDIALLQLQNASGLPTAEMA